MKNPGFSPTEVVKEIYSPREMADFFGVSLNTLNRWANAGLIGHFRTLGGHRRYLRSHVVEFLETQASRETREANQKNAFRRRAEFFARFAAALRGEAEMESAGPGFGGPPQMPS